MQSFAKTHVQFARHKARAWREPRQTPSGERRALGWPVSALYFGVCVI